jgi:hypothetical protein
MREGVGIGLGAYICAKPVQKEDLSGPAQKRIITPICGPCVTVS